VLRNKNRNIWVERIKDNNFLATSKYFNSESMNSIDIRKLQIFNVVEVTTSLSWFKGTFFHVSLPFLSTKYCL